MKHTPDRDLVKLLLAWYDQYARPLPWRINASPYHIWISEIMLQQTRVDTVIPYYYRWMKCLPTLPILAKASQQDVLKLWEGLGYYHRARNLHLTARLIMHQYNGCLPGNRKELQKLPGIGRYSAAAIASIAFGENEATLDGNIRRVLCRLFKIEKPAGSKESENLLWKLARQYLPSGHAGDYNQALMELGSQICTVNSPLCQQCPLSELCESFSLNLQEVLPYKKTRKKIPHYIVTAAVIYQNGKYLITQRPAKGLLGGMWEFPGGKLEPAEELQACLKRELQEELGIDIQVDQLFGTYRHAYTHFRITLHAYHCRITDGEPYPYEASKIYWAAPEELSEFPMGKIDRQIANKLSENTSVFQTDIEKKLINGTI